MTSNDVRDILSLPERSGARPSSSSAHASGSSSSRNRKASGSHHNPHPSTAAASSRQKPKYDGMTRELFALLGDNAPTLAMAHGLGAEGSHAGGSGVGALFKPKFKRSRKEKVQQWRWTPFFNSAREDTQIDEDTPELNDGLVLHHWAPARSTDGSATNVDTEPVTKYQYAEFNTNSGVYSYSNDEYIQHLRDDDWTKEETDYLMDLCAAYDLRFVVIHDRYDWASAQPSYLASANGGGAVPAPSQLPVKERSMEDLKARYYAICRRLIRSRISADDVETRQVLLSTYAFDKQREVERKKAVARLYTRTPEQLAEEEALYVEIRRIEQNEAKYASEREELLRLLGGWESLPSSSPHAVAAAGSGIASLLGGTGEEDAAKVAELAALQRSESCNSWKKLGRPVRRIRPQREVRRLQQRRRGLQPVLRRNNEPSYDRHNSMRCNASFGSLPTLPFLPRVILWLPAPHPLQRPPHPPPPPVLRTHTSLAQPPLSPLSRRTHRTLRPVTAFTFDPHACWHHDPIWCSKQRRRWLSPNRPLARG